MAQITDVSLKIEDAGPHVPESMRVVDVKTTISFTAEEVANRTSFTETVSLYGWDNGINLKEKLIEFPSTRTIVARRSTQEEYFIAYVRRETLDEDKVAKGGPPWVRQILYDRDEIAAEVCLTPVDADLSRGLSNVSKADIKL